MKSSKFMRSILLNLNNKKNNPIGFNSTLLQNKKKSIEFPDINIMELQKQRYKKKSVEIPKHRSKKNSLEFLNIKPKKNSIEFFNQRNSKLSNILNKFEITRKKSITSYNGISYNNKVNSSFSASDIDYKGIGEEIKYTILEMKNNLIEV